MNHPVHEAMLPVLLMLMPLAGGLLALLASVRFPRLATLLVIAGALAACVIAAVLALDARDGLVRTISLVQIAPPVWITLRVDPFGALFVLTVAGLFLLALIHAFGYLGDDPRKWRFFVFALACQSCMTGVAFAGNLVTLFVFYELFSLLSYPLITHDRSREAMAAGLKYLVYIVGAGSFILVGTILIFHLGGETEFTRSGLAVMDGSRGLLLTTLICLSIGFGVKSALMPVHGWVPDAHPAAPAPFSAVLSGVMVATGVFGLLRVWFELFGPARMQVLGVLPWLGAVAGVTVLLAAFRAIGEDNLKRRLAWSTISQMAYVVLAVTVLSGPALAAAMVHVVHHAFLKGGLFFSVGLIVVVTGCTRVSDLTGLSRRLPLTSLVLTLLGLGLIGVPPLAGFISKWLLGVSLADADALLRLGIVLGGTLLAAVYIWPIIYRIWRVEESCRFRRQAGPEASPWMLVALVMSALVVVVLGVAAGLPGFPVELARGAADWLMGGGP
jgi:multicomponent Na+:H+ antiporter subunit D